MTRIEIAEEAWSQGFIEGVKAAEEDFLEGFTLYGGFDPPVEQIRLISRLAEAVLMDAPDKVAIAKDAVDYVYKLTER